MGTKHWDTGRVRTSRYGGRYVDVYPNTPGEKFQDGTAYEFNEPTYPDELRSADCGVGSVTLNVTEQVDPFADANGQVKDIMPDGNLEYHTIVDTQSQTYPIYKGDTFKAEAFGDLPSSGSNPTLSMQVLKNGVEVYNETEPSSPTTLLEWEDPVPIEVDDEYIVNVISAADDPTAPVSCGIPTSYGGGESFPTDTFITLGAGLGEVELNYNANSIPDKFEVWFDGIKVIDTGYRGDTSYQAALNAALAAMSPPLPPETIIAGGVGVASFVKTTPSVTALVRVYAPLSGTAWDFTLGCPVAP